MYELDGGQPTLNSVPIRAGNMEIGSPADHDGPRPAEAHLGPFACPKRHSLAVIRWLELQFRPILSGSVPASQYPSNLMLRVSPNMSCMDDKPRRGGRSLQRRPLLSGPSSPVQALPPSAACDAAPELSWMRLSCRCCTKFPATLRAGARSNLESRIIKSPFRLPARPKPNKWRVKLQNLRRG